MRPAPHADSSTTETTDRQRARGRQARAARTRRRGALEWLEPRALMATLPSPTAIGGAPIDVSNSRGDESAPVVAVDPNNPQRMVAVWTRNDQRFTNDARFNPRIFTEGAVSTDGGANWSKFADGQNSALANPLRDPTTSMPTIDYAQITDASVAFDRLGNFYVLNRHSVGDSSRGALVLNKFSFAGAQPTALIDDRIIYEWAGADAALTPTIAVDDSVASFTDPETGAVQANRFAGNVYVSWTSVDAATAGNPLGNDFNPNRIRVVASSDGGATFSGQAVVNAGGNFGAQRNGSPRLVVSQGTADGRVAPGQVTVIWDDFGSGATASPPVDFLRSSAFRTGATAQAFNGAGGPITDGADPGGGAAHIAGVTNYPIPVNITDADFTTLSDLDVRIAAVHPSLGEVGMLLIPPPGSGLPSVRLFQNQTNGLGQTPNALIGLTGANLGINAQGFAIGTTFDDQATRNVVDVFNNARGAAAPFIGHFRPEFGSLLGAYGGATPAQLNGTWTLQVTDSRASGTPPPAQGVNAIGLTFTAGLTDGPDSTVAVTLVRGNANGGGTVASPATPLGIGPGAVLAADSTLGSFSPFQGRLYATFVDRFDTQDNPADNTDIFLAVSDNGGTTWQNLGKVNDDNALLDGYTESFEVQGISFQGRPQFLPQAAVDQSTGTLVMTWFDTRDDAARARVATYVTTSNNGGAEFSDQVFLNAPKTALDAIERETVTLAPLPDNQSPGNPVREATVGFGTRSGLAAAGGRIVAAWASNQNFAGVNNDGADGNALLDVRVARATLTAGPRIVGGTMGPVGEPGDAINPLRAADGSPIAGAFVVTFDRPVDPATFGVQDVQVFFRDTTPGNVSGGPVPVQQVTPLDFGPQGPAGILGATRFRVNFAPRSAVGTYSYVVGPDVRDRIRTTAISVNPNNDPTPFNPPAGEQNLPLPAGVTSTAASTITVGSFAPTSVVADVNVRVQIDYPFSGDLDVTLVSPSGRRVTLAQFRPTFAGGSGLGSYPDATFDDDGNFPSLAVSTDPFTGTFTPDAPLSQFDGEAINGDWTLEVTDAFALDMGTFVTWTLTLSSGTLQVGGTTGNQMDQDADGFDGEAPNDLFAAPRPLAGPNGQPPILRPPFDPATLPLIVPGPHVATTGVPGNPATADNLVLNGKVDALDVTFDRDMQVGTFTGGANGDVLRLQGPGGVIPPSAIAVRPAFNAPAVPLTIPDNAATPLVATLVVPDDGGAFTIGDLDVRVDLTHPRLADLRVVLIAPDGTRVRLAEGLAGANLEGTTFDDEAALGVAAGFNPFTGRFRPVAPLSALDGRELRGTWRLEITDANPAAGGAGGILRAWSLAATPEIVTAAVVARTFRLSFPIQQLGGSYTLGLSPQILSANGDAIDENLNAGLDLLRGVTSTGATEPITATSTDVPVSILDNRTVSSTIVVTDNFLIADVNLSLNIVHPNVPDLSAVLVAPDGTRVTLFTNVGDSGNRDNFSNTVFDDQAATPIQNGGPPFFGAFNPQEPLSALIGKASAGTYTLEITDSAAGNTGTLTAWSLVLAKPVPASGLGEASADRTALSFRIFTMDPTDPIASSTWTAVGPANINGDASGGSGSGRIGGLALDPSDPSRNTLFVAGATGGVWKTTNFLTTDAQGPTYIPLTDFGPTTSLNVGGIAVFGRNNDPAQSIVFVATGDGDGGAVGVGFLRSTDGGANWDLLDSTVNVDAQGNILPIDSPLRDHAFVGTTAYKVLVDPRPTPSGDTIVYAALAGGNGGLWRSFDTGRTWTRLRAGQVTDIALDLNSGTGTATSNPTNNLQILYAAFRGEGVFLSPNQGTVLNLMTGGIGVPLIQDNEPAAPVPVAVAAPAGTPNGPKGRIVIARPELTGDRLKDVLYQGWLYAAVATPNDALDGLYVTKDFGQNWTRVRLPERRGPNNTLVPIPSNDAGANGQGGLTDVNPLGNQGNFDITLAVDPNNPNVVYLGGQNDDGVNASTGLIRVDITGIADPHALVAYDDNQNDGGLLSRASQGRLILKRPTGDRSAPPPAILNLIQDPSNPFLTNATILLGDTIGSTITPGNALRFSNTGADGKWIPFDVSTGIIEGSADQHRILAFRDPLTGGTRLVFGDDQGVFSGVDRGDGRLATDIGTARLPSIARNGNLQITQIYYGASQPSNLAAQVAGALFYGQAQDDGFPRSDPGLLQNGQLTWFGGFGDGTGVATDQTGSGTAYHYDWPCCGGNVTDFFRVDLPNGNPSDGVGRTFGLIQQSGNGQVPDPQWPFLGGFNFAVNPINNQQIIMGSGAGRFFSTENQGQFWTVIADPQFLDGTEVRAPAFGAPDPAGPGGVTDQNNFLYAGTVGGRIFVTRSGGGSQGNQWTNVSGGLDGSPVMAIVTNPTRGSHEAYAVTQAGVYHIVDSTVAGASWVNITANLFNITHDPFDNPALREARLNSLTSLVADWRYVIPNDFNAPPANPNDPAGTHPLLYVAGEGGVYRSNDDGLSWRLFPSAEPNSLNTTPDPPGVGGGLPNNRVTDLDLALGNVNPTTGRADVATGPNLLLASTFGRGAFAIRLAPLVFADSLRLAAGSDSGTTGEVPPVTNVTTPTLAGYSAQTAFGNAVTIRLIDLTDPANPRVVPLAAGTETTDAAGRFAIRVAPGFFPADGSADGLKVLGVQAIDGAGTEGNIAFFRLVIDTTIPPVPTLPDLQLASDTGLFPPFFPNGDVDNYTRDNTPSFTVGNLEGANVVQLLRDGLVVATLTVPGTAAGQSVTLTDPGPLSDGNHTYQAQQVDPAGNASGLGGPPPPSLTVRIDTSNPSTPAAPRLFAADNSGDPNDSITNDSTPRVTGTIAPTAGEVAPVVQIVNASDQVLGQGFAVGNTYTIAIANLQGGPLSDGLFVLRARAVDQAGNVGAASPTFNLTISTAQPPPVSLVLLPQDDSGTIGDNVTNVRRPRLTGNTGPGLQVEILDRTAGSPGVSLGTVPAANGTFNFQFANNLADGTYTIVARAFDVAGNQRFSAPLVLTIDTAPPSNIPPLQISDGTIAGVPDTDTGRAGDNRTSIRQPIFVGTTDPGAAIDVIGPTGAVLGQAVADSNGRFAAQLANNLVNGTIVLRARARDLAGNQGTPGAPLTLVVTTTIGDFNSDGRADLGLFRPSGATWLVTSPSTGTNPRNQPFGASTDTPLLGDFDGDGIDDLAVFRPSTADWFILGSQGRAQAVRFGAGGLDLPVPADYDGDGTTDLAVFRPTTAQWFVIRSSGGATATAFGAANLDVPVQADFDGDLRADLAVFRPTTAQWFVLQSGGGTQAVTFGATNLDVPVQADYDGDNKADIALFRPTTAQWFILQSGGGARAATFGLADDVPAPADYDDDGKADLATFRAPTGAGQYSFLASTTGATSTNAFGASNDIPLASPLRFRHRVPNSILNYGSAAGGIGTGRSAALAAAAAPTTAAAAGEAAAVGQVAARSVVAPATATAAVATPVAPTLGRRAAALAAARSRRAAAQASPAAQPPAVAPIAAPAAGRSAAVDAALVRLGRFRVLRPSARPRA